MFADSTDSLQVDFPSEWRKHVQSKESGIQTVPIKTKDSGTQGTPMASIEIQTDPEPERPLVLLRNYNAERLEMFLSAAYPNMSAQLMRNLRSSAFGGYTVNWDEEIDAVSVRHVLEHKQREAGSIVTCLSWNATGSTVAVAYGRHDHKNWCTHKGLLASWSFAQREIQTSAAHYALETPSCLLCVEFHPKLPNLIVGGVFNGDILIWDLYREENMLLATSKMSDFSHQEPVTKVAWLESPKSGNHRILSLGSDGRILVWELANNTIQLLLGAQLLLNRVPRQFRSHVSLQGDIALGGTCFSIFHENSNEFVVGVEGGQVFKCKISAMQDIKTSTPGKPLPNPVSVYFNGHTGPVYGVACSPFHRNLFLSCSTDGTVRLFSNLQADCIRMIEPNAGYMNAVDWSRSRPTVFAGATSDGRVLIYDLAQNTPLPFVSLEAVSNASSVVTSIAFSVARQDLLATGDSSGEIRIWRLSSYLVKEASHDRKCLDDLSG